MKNKKIVIAVIAFFVFAVVGMGAYLLGRYQNSKSDTGLVFDGDRKMLGDEGRGGVPEENTVKDMSGGENPYVGDDFTFVPPQGWIQTAIPSTLVSYQKQDEAHESGSAADKINFKSYFAVSFDNTSGQTIDQIMDLIKTQTESVAPSIVFGQVMERMINGMPARTVEADLVMQGVDFKVLMAVIMGDGKYYTVSFNTTAAKWGGYTEDFYGVLDSFKLKNVLE